MTVITGRLSAIGDALDSHLKALVLSPVLPIAWRNVPYDPVAGAPYLAPTLLANTTDLMAVGTNSPRRFRGLYQVTIFGVEGIGALADEERADAISEHFSPKGLGLDIPRNGLSVQIGSADGSSGIPRIAPPIRTNGWIATPVTVPWFCDVFQS